MHVLGRNRGQVELLCLEAVVDAESPARQIDGIIDGLDTSYFERSAVKDTGRPPYDPKDLLKLFVYGCDRGLRSSRRLNRETKINVEVMWLLRGLQPDDKTICNFRKENAENLKRFFNEFVKRLKDADYIDGKIVSVDGTKIRANNGKRNNYSVKKLDRLIDRIDSKIAGYMSELDKNDKIEELKERKAEYESYKERIENGEVSEVSATDPDSRLMKQGNNGTDVSYNVQTAVDSKHKLIAGILVTNEPNDQNQLHKVAKSVKANLGLKEMIVPADKGYYSTEDFKNCHEDNITTIVPRPDDNNSDGVGFKKDRFEYDKEKDCYRCPAGRTLGFSYEDENGFRRYQNRKACTDCALKKKCTNGIRRVITRHKFIEAAEKNDRDFADNQHIYKQRQLLSEHPFGTVKRTMGVRQFLTMGLTNVTAETALIFLAYNLKRLRVINKTNGDKDEGALQLIRLFAGLFLISIIAALTSKKLRPL